VEEEIYRLRSIDDFTKLGYSLRSTDILTKHKYSSLQGMNRREGVFSPKAQKRYVYKSFMHRKEVDCKISLHIRFKTIHIKYYRLSSINVTLIT
jgi:hypothetical protein